MYPSRDTVESPTKRGLVVLGQLLNIHLSESSQGSVCSNHILRRSAVESAEESVLHDHRVLI